MTVYRDFGREFILHLLREAKHTYRFIALTSWPEIYSKSIKITVNGLWMETFACESSGKNNRGRVKRIPSVGPSLGRGLSAIKLVSTEEHAVCITPEDLHSNMAMMHMTYQQKTYSVKALRMLISLNRPDQPHLRPPPHSMGSRPLFKLGLYSLSELCWRSAVFSSAMAVLGCRAPWPGLQPMDWLNLEPVSLPWCCLKLWTLGWCLQVWPASLAQALWSGAWLVRAMAVGSPSAPGAGPLGSSLAPLASWCAVWHQEGSNKFTACCVVLFLFLLDQHKDRL